VGSRRRGQRPRTGLGVEVASWRRSKSSRMAYCLGVRSKAAPFSRTSRSAERKTRSPHSSRPARGMTAVARRRSARTRARSSAKANGLTK
jgi:hypothetical protein